MNFQQALIDEYDRECSTTRKLLDAIPADADLTWKASPKNMTLGRLAGHVAEIPGEWGVMTLAQPGLAMPEGPYDPWQPASKAEILEKFDSAVPQAKEVLAGLDAARWDDNWKMTSGEQVWVSDTRYNVFRTWVLNHMIHHRAQLGRDLRVLGAPIPGCYGPSADQM